MIDAVSPDSGGRVPAYGAVVIGRSGLWIYKISRGMLFSPFFSFLSNVFELSLKRLLR